MTVGRNWTIVAFRLVKLYKRDVLYPNKDKELGFHNPCMFTGSLRNPTMCFARDSHYLHLCKDTSD